MRKKKGRWISFLFMMLLISGLSACGKQKEPEDDDSYIYSLNEDQTGIVKRPYPIGGEDTKSQVESILKGLETPSDEIEYTDVFPDNVKIREWNVQDSIVYVDFNAAYLEMETVHEKLVRSALVQSLLQADQVAGVWISVEENALKETDGKVVGILNEDDFVEPLYHHVAALVFEELRATGQVMPARILNQFEDVEEQKTAASLFNTRLKTDDDPAVREKALNETVKRIKKNSLELKSRSVREIADLQKIIKEKAQLQKLYISL